METITLLPIEQLHESPFNPRKIFDEQSLDELAVDIKAQNVLSPLLVRPNVPPMFKDDPHGAAGHEIVFGHRRYRAALRAGLTVLPCMVRAMSDDEARRAQISENLQRKDVHPLEEAEGFQQLIDSDHQTADAIAATFGKSRSYVYGRLKLLEACPAVRDACLAGDIGSETALLFARRPAALQVKALEKLQSTQFYRARNGYTDGGKEGFRAVQDFLNEYFMLDLKEALWQLDDAELLPAAGACTTCPKRSGCAPELFADVIEEGKSGRHLKGGTDVCTDPDCFADKKKAHLKLAAVALEAQGKVVIAGAKARQIIGADGAVKGGYIEASKVRDLIKKAKADVTIATAQNPRDGKTKQVVKVEDLQSAGIKMAETKPAKVAGRDYEAERKKEEAKAELETKVRRALFARVRDAAGAQPRSEFDMQLLAVYMLDMVDYDNEHDLCAAYGVKRADEIAHQVPAMSVDQVANLMLAIAMSHEIECDSWNLERSKAKYLMTAAKHYGVDVAEVRAEISAKRPTPDSAARAPKGATTKSGAKKAAPAAAEAWDKSFPKPKSKSKAKEQKDNAGAAGESDSQADLLADTEA